MKKSIVLLLILLTSTVSYAEVKGWRNARSMAYSIISDGGDLYAYASDEKKDLKYNEQLPCHADLQVTPHGVATVVLKDVSCSTQREGDMDIPVSEVIRALHEENDETVSVSCDKQTCKIRYKFIPDYYRRIDFNALKASDRDSSAIKPIKGTKEGAIGNPNITRYASQLKECSSEVSDDPCILYIKNTSDSDEKAEELFKEAAQKTGRQEYLIHIENQHYAKTNIPPGEIAEIRIPPLR